MPADQTQKPCPENGCYGVMTYYAKGKPRVMHGDGRITYAPGSGPGWLCNKDFLHWEDEKKTSHAP